MPRRRRQMTPSGPFSDWTPPVEGVKASLTRRPTARELLAQQYAAEVLQNRYERWLQWHYSRILASMRRDFEALDHLPDDAEIEVIVRRSESTQIDVLRRMYLQIYPSAASMVIPDDTLKGLRRMEAKAELTLEQQRILRWIEDQLRLNVSAMSSSTVRILQALRQQTLEGSAERLDQQVARILGPNGVLLGTGTATSRYDAVDFMHRLEDSGVFDTARARRIAITETNSAVNESLAQASEEAADGEAMVKTWMTSGRTNVRDTHRRMADVTVPFEDFYMVPNRLGGTDRMMYPGDRAHGAGPENYMNCHCKSFPRLAEFE